MKTIKSLFCLSLLTVFFLSISPIGASASENGNGGQVTTNGVITFYEETAPSSSSSEPQQSSEYPKTSGSDVTVKPVGKYPSTGEIIQGSIGIGGGLLAAAAVLFLLYRRKKEKEGN